MTHKEAAELLQFLESLAATQIEVTDEIREAIARDIWELYNEGESETVIEEA